MLELKETPTWVNSHYEAADDEHLKRFGHLTQGQQQCSYYSKAVIHQQGSLSVVKRKTQLGSASWTENVYYRSTYSRRVIQPLVHFYEDTNRRSEWLTASQFHSHWKLVMFHIRTWRTTCKLCISKEISFSSVNTAALCVFVFGSHTLSFDL